MYWFFILLLLALIGFGYYVYQRLIEVEKEIRADQRALAEEVDTQSPVQSPSPVPEPQEESIIKVAVAGTDDLTGRILGQVKEAPGLSQADLYGQFPDEDRRDLQKLLRKLDQQKQLRREKKGNSYRLYPL